jgi:hypothetical protein
MGAQDYEVVVTGKTAKEAFGKAVEEARYYYGHRGYTGSIAEKSEFVLINVPEGRNPQEYARELVNNEDERIADKWGPSGCIEIEPGKFLFFGSASS